MHLENDKAFWLSRNNLINLFSVNEFKEKIIKINVFNSKEFKDFSVLDSLIMHNENLIILKTNDYNIYLSLPFNFESNFNNLEEIINFIQNDREIFIFFIELGSWIIGKIKFKEILASKRGSRYVKGRHKAGGQSQRRFERNREKWIEELYKKFVLNINDFFKKNIDESDYYLAFGEEKVINDLFNYDFKNKNKFIKRKSSLKNYNSKTLVSASTNIWSSRVYIDTKNAIVKNYD
ncbi:MAG: Vms1/Ankzf1 family peptidyl-tRNA hydrolase [Dehalococcoidia bacterium]|nr:hypothetical protein [Chloroflexota bacterium]|tara:strand:+ start:2148 stop:2852 length:705 start_codon:yes stop_codon:yes gene_type:complete